LSPRGGDTPRCWVGQTSGEGAGSAAGSTQGCSLLRRTWPESRSAGLALHPRPGAGCGQLAVGPADGGLGRAPGKGGFDVELCRPLRVPEPLAGEIGKLLQVDLLPAHESRIDDRSVAGDDLVGG